jgi:lysozyme family protein
MLTSVDQGKLMAVLQEAMDIVRAGHDEEPATTSDRFAICLERVLRHEGGFVDHPDDPGGATNKGITLATAREYFGDGYTVEELQHIAREEVARIYREGYWDKVSADGLPTGLDYTAFDSGIHAGPFRAAQWLQRALGVEDDGIVGPLTLAAASERDATKKRHAVNVTLDMRLESARRIDNGRWWRTFGKGVQRRIDEVRAVSLEEVVG